MRRRLWLVFASCALMLLSLGRGWAKSEFFRIEDLRAGMKGIGKTCYQGTKVEEFDVEILGILNGVNPGSSAVIARLGGGLLEKTGLFEGMSGSPVFIEGKLLGAVAFTYPFAKEAIGGITPIGEMIRAFEELEQPIPGTKVIFKKSGLAGKPIPADRGQPAATRLEIPARRIGGQAEAVLADSRSLIPIATPVSLSGVHAETLKLFGPRFREMGLSLQQGGGGSAPGSKAASSRKAGVPVFEPGSNIVVSLVRGDLDVSAAGTVTYVDGDKVYAFGHGMFELGFTELPMHEGAAIAVFPSLESSFKILETGALAGTIRQDRGAGVYGVVGENPRLVPLKVSLATSRGNKREYKYELARDRLLTPLLVQLTVYNTIIATERSQGSTTLKVKGKIRIKNEQPVEVENRFSSDSGAVSDASLSVAVPVDYLMAGGYRNLDLENIEVDVTVAETDRAALLDAIRLGNTEIRAGETQQLEISYRKADGELLKETYPVKMPANASPGPLTMLVADGTALMSMDDQEEDAFLVPRDLTHLIKLINNLRKNDRLYVRFFRREPGLMVQGEGMPGLPPSYLSILRSGRKAGAVHALRTSTLLEYELPASDYVVSGAKTLELTVKP